MGSFFIEFRDPLFSVIILLALIFSITFLSYWWGRYRTKENSKELDRFLQQFHALPTENELKILISSGELSQKSWLLLANSYMKNGDLEKAIEIYLEILRLPNALNRGETMFLLGNAYFKAGFLERAKQIFLEILHKSPRTLQALHALLLVYEYLRDYKSALEVLEPLDELGEEIQKDEIYLKILALLHNVQMSQEEKTSQIISLSQKHNQLTYMIFEYLFRINPTLAWEHFNTSQSEILIDILWNLPPNALNLAIISENKFLRELYSARGDVSLSTSSEIFELDLLINLSKAPLNATLCFEYSCGQCKNIYPFAFNRCSHCHAIDTQTIEWSITKSYQASFNQENNSFQ